MASTQPAAGAAGPVGAGEARPGRRAPARTRDATRTREAILDAARTLFAEHGYEGATVRMVAAEAGITQGLITRYFGSKEGLFLAASDVSLRSADAMAGPREQLGERMAAGMVGRWRQQGTAADPLLILMRAAGSRPEAAAVLHEVLEREATSVLAARLAADGMAPQAARERALAVGALITGVVMTRRVLVPFTAGDADDLQAWLACSLQALLDHGPG